MTSPPARARAVLVACCALVAACAGEVRHGSTSGTSGGPGAGAGGSAAGEGGGTGAAGSAATPSSLLHLPNGPAPTARLHKLTAAEFTNSVHDLLGAAAPLATIEPDNVKAGFATVGATEVAISPAGVGQYEEATGMATGYAFADATRAASVLPCVPTSATDQACATRAIAALGRRAFRRPLTDAETARYATLATTIAGKPGGSALAGMRHVAWAMLQSPSFLYRVELGAPSAADGGRLKFGDFEMASRLAATLWGSVPDDALLDAAAQGTLATGDGVRAQAVRMLADPRAHRALAVFVDDYFGLRELEETTKDPAVFPGWTTTLRDAMRHELEARVEDMVFARKGDFLTLHASRSTFVDNELAAYYGLPKAPTDSWRAVDLPADSPRVGLLGAGAILAAYALPQRTSPTARGKFVATSLLCKIVPPPPPGVPPLPAMAGPDASVRDRLTMHRAAASCTVCHALMDPLGFGMETFDGAAKFRATDNGKAIDATGVLDGRAFDGLAQLGAAVSAHPAAGACLVSRYYAYAQGRAPNGADAEALDGLATRFASAGNRVDQLLVDLVSSDAFRFVQPGAQ